MRDPHARSPGLTGLFDVPAASSVRTTSTADGSVPHRGEADERVGSKVGVQERLSRFCVNGG